ncbi:6-phosphogluconolactonase [Candidatus Palibaumannia cicadellinicola]|uniref:6-phosphogluconolactonase n=1 Tax=Candidatus Palibaumannia cicadellinicola TaxID=186490 RepID=A0A0K2BK56_9GAMM|nr:6-phosphogluconolactonase [Candidatus Baumannia cicadellinicola]AKZ65806.1 6-phosphogluconolactonase [Candidatus Baumannia cicadellinicola]
MKTFVYVSSPESKNIHVFKMDTSGILKLLQVVNTPGIGQPMIIHPAKTHLYLGVRPVCSIISYSINNNNGLLHEENTSLLPSTLSPTHLTTDLSGRTLYCTSYNGSCLSVSQINENGIASKPIQIIDSLINCHSSNIDTNNKVVWVPCLTEDRIRLFYREKTGTLTPCSPEAVHNNDGTGPRHMVFHHSGRYAYVINELNSSVTIYSNAGNFPCILKTINFMPDLFYGVRWAADIHITPDGKWLYCSDRSASIIACFSVSDDGSKLHLIGHHNTEKQPRGFNIDATGSYLIVSGQKSNHITVYSINKTNGFLNILSRNLVGKGPIFVVILQL